MLYRYENSCNASTLVRLHTFCAGFVNVHSRRLLRRELMVNRCKRVVSRFPSRIAEAGKMIYELQYAPKSENVPFSVCVVFIFMTIFRIPLSRLTGIPRPKVLLQGARGSVGSDEGPFFFVAIAATNELLLNSISAYTHYEKTTTPHLLQILNWMSRPASSSPQPLLFTLLFSPALFLR